MANSYGHDTRNKRSVCQVYNRANRPRLVFLQSHPPEGRFHETHASGVGCGACGFGLVSRAPGRLRGSALRALRPVCWEPAGPPERVAPGGKRGPKSVRRPKAQHEIAAVKRRKARRPALWAGGSRTAFGTGPAARRATGAAIRTSACRRFTSLGLLGESGPARERRKGRRPGGTSPGTFGRIKIIR
jgi:hypothetical protein